MSDAALSLVPVEPEDDAIEPEIVEPAESFAADDSPSEPKPLFGGKRYSGRTPITLDHDEVARVLREVGGNLSQAASILGCSRSRLEREMKASPSLQVVRQQSWNPKLAREASLALARTKRNRPQPMQQERMIEAIRRSKGLLANAAKILGVSQRTVRYWVAKYPAIREVVEEERDRLRDLAEIRLFEAVDRGEAWAIQTVIRTLCRERGYAERTEVTGPQGGKIEISVEYVNDWRNIPTIDIPDSTEGGR